MPMTPGGFDAFAKRMAMRGGANRQDAPAAPLPEARQCPEGQVPVPQPDGTTACQAHAPDEHAAMLKGLFGGGNYDRPVAGAVPPLGPTNAPAGQADRGGFASFLAARMATPPSTRPDDGCPPGYLMAGQYGCVPVTNVVVEAPPPTRSPRGTGRSGGRQRPEQ